MSITGYRAAPTAIVLSYGAGRRAISHGRTSVRGAVTVAPSSVTELILRPAGIG